MAGFCLENRTSEPAAGAPALRLVDLGGPDTERTFARGPVRFVWSFRNDSRESWTREEDGRLLFIEGQPDRYPREGESLQDWLSGGRWGSYRGVEIRAPREASLPAEITVFGDPLGTRSVYIHRTPERLLVSDKLSTIAVNADGEAEVHWPALLEAMALGSLYTPDTTLRNVEELAPGAAVEFAGLEARRRKHYELPAEGEVDAQAVHRDPAGTLLAAMKQAVAETWTDPRTALLLSGGLDSRLMLALAGPGRKALTVQLYEAETQIARQLAACCDCELRVYPYLPEYTLRSVRLATPAGGAMHDPHFFNHLGMGAQWRSEGVTAVTHAYLFDTLLKGYFVQPAGGITRTALARTMPKTAKFFERISGRGSHVAADDIIQLLSARGREALDARLSALDASVKVETESGLDLTFENFVLGRISRQVHYGTLLGWSEELDVSSPIFHPALWSWRAASRAADRLHGRAFTRALLSLDHKVVKIADSNTGAPPRMPEVSWRDSIRHNHLYQRFLQPLWKSLAGARDEVSFKSGLGGHLRGPEGIRFLTEWTAEIGGCEWFDAAVIESFLTKFKAGDDRYIEPLLACASAARWQRIIRSKSIGE